MGVDYSASFGIGVEVEIDKDKLAKLTEFDDVSEFLDEKLEGTHFAYTYYGNMYCGEKYYCIILEDDLSKMGLNLEPYKAELDKWLSEQDVCKPVGEFGLVGGVCVY